MATRDALRVHAFNAPSMAVMPKASVARSSREAVTIVKEVSNPARAVISPAPVSNVKAATNPANRARVAISPVPATNHVNHVNTQLPYALTVAGVSFVAYIVAPFVGSPWIALPIAVVLLVATLFLLRPVLGKTASSGDISALSRKFARSISDRALSAALSRMSDSILADGRIDEAEAEQLAHLLEGVEGHESFKKALAAALADGVITSEESATLETFVRTITGRKA